MNFEELGPRGKAYVVLHAMRRAGALQHPDGTRATFAEGLEWAKANPDLVAAQIAITPEEYRG